MKVKHLNEWGASNGDVFHVLDSPGKVTISDLKDWETGKVIEAGYYRSYVDFGYEPEKPQAATGTPEVNVPAQKADTVPAPVTGDIVTVSDSPKEEVPASDPLPVTTGDIAFAFDGLHGWSEEQWKKPLGDKPKWLAACVAIPGVRGVAETRWNPVLIGAALVHDWDTKPNSVRARFQTKPQLMPWLDAWKTYEADNIDTA